jgi:hypothetical protein
MIFSENRFPLFRIMLWIPPVTINYAIGRQALQMGELWMGAALISAA